VTDVNSGGISMSEMRTVRGMRDLMGPEMQVKNNLMAIAVEIFELYGYEPLDSPVMELWETLSAKGGEDVEADTFKFRDKGEREVGLRFDLTVPLARIVATNPHLPKPFKRYALGKAWRYDRPQAGRYREFEQADVDIVGSPSPAADAEVVLVALEFLERVLGSDYKIRINNRKVLRGMTEKAGVPDELAFECFRAIDKLDKIGKDGVLKELDERGIGKSQSDFLIDAIKIKGSGIKALKKFRNLLRDSEIGIEGVDELTLMAKIFEQSGVSDQIEFDMSLARGLDYYTGPVFEGRYLGKPKVGSILGGGRYDHLIERFGGPTTPATGISLGIGRLIEVVLARKPRWGKKKRLHVYIIPTSDTALPKCLSIQNALVKDGTTIRCTVDLMGRRFKKSIQQAEKSKARFALIIGERELESGTATLRKMSTKSEESIEFQSLVEIIKDRLYPQRKL
jgi:histidyl-tRNA synthetase